MNFERHNIQTYIEGKVGCHDVEKWLSYKSKLENLTLGDEDVNSIADLALQDASFYFQKSLLSLYEAIDGICKCRTSWATVKLYYSLFYSLRANILLSQHILVRCGSLYYFRVNKGERLKKFSPRKIRGDHQLTVKFVEKLHKRGILTDPILDGRITDLLPYLWMMKIRERINYQQVNFYDPEVVDWLKKPFEYIDNGEHFKLFELYSNDDNYIFCFDEEHAFLSIPYRKIISTKNKLESLSINIESQIRNKQHICTMIDFKIEKIISL